MADPSQSPDPVALLHIDDSPADVLLIKEALADCQIRFCVTHIASGEDGLQYLQRAGSNEDAKPDLILLDLELPKVPGYELLRFVKSHDSLWSIPVIVLSGLVYADSLLGDYRTSVQQLLCKPEDGDNYQELAQEIEQIWLDITE